MSYMSRVSDDLLAKEEEYHRLNEEIEQRTRQLAAEVANMSYEEELSLRKSLENSQPSLAATNLLEGLNLNRSPSPLDLNIADTQSKPSKKSPVPDVLPPEAAELAPESQVRLLKAKTRVLEEEVERLSKELTAQKQDLARTRQELKSEKEEKIAIQKTCQTSQGQMEKYLTLIEEKKNKNKTLEAEVSRLRKDVESHERAEKKFSQSQKTLEVRLDRAVQEVEKYKSLLSAAKSQASESSNYDREAVSRLQAENKVLEKQKVELINAYKKQMKLVDVLRKQKLHLEASRMLNFTQEEFMKVLDWKSG